MVYLFSLYTWELNFGQTICNKTEVLLGTCWGTHWKIGNLLRTWWEHVGEHIGNKEEKQKITHPTPLHPEKEKKQGPSWVCGWAFPLAACNFYFQNCLSPFFGPGLMVGAEIWGHREHIGNPLGTWKEHVGNKGKMKNILPPTPKLKENKIKALWVHMEPSH